MKNKIVNISRFTTVTIVIVSATIGLITNLRAGDDSAPATQPPKQSGTQTNVSGKLDGVIVNMDFEKKLIKVVIWDSDNGGFKTNDVGRYQARTLKWSGDTVIEDQGEKKISAFATDNGLPDLKSVNDLVGWKTSITFDNGLVSKISLVVIFSGESFAGMGGNGGFAFAQQPSGKIPAERTKELDNKSDSIDK